MEFIAVRKNKYRGKWMRKIVLAAGCISLMLMLTACGDSPGYSYTLGGVVTGMAGSGLVLQNNGGNDVTVSANGSFTFRNAITDGGAYNVTIATQPSGVNQTCVVVNGSGVVKGSIVSVQVNCVLPPARFATDSDTSAKYAYAVKYSGTTNTAFTITPATGALVSNGTAATGTHPNSISVTTFDATQYYAYVPNFGSNTVSVYTIGTDGTLTAGTAKTTGTNPVSVAFKTIGGNSYAYVPNFGSNNISVYDVGIGGALTEKSPTGSPVAAGTNPSSITVHPTNNFAYAVNTSSASIYIYTINSDGSLTAGAAVSTGTNPGPVVLNPAGLNTAGTTAYVANTGSNTISVYIVDTSTGALTQSATVSTASNPVTVVITPNGRFAYVPNLRSNAISAYTIGTDGALSAYANIAAGTNPYAIAIDPTSGYLYAANYGSNNISVYAIESTGNLTLKQTKDAGTNPYQLTVKQTSSATVLYAVHAGAGNIYAYVINSDGTLKDPTTVAY